MNAHPQGSTPAERPEDAADAPEVFTSRRARRAAEARRAAAGTPASGTDDSAMDDSGTDAAAAETEAADAAAVPPSAADRADTAAAPQSAADHPDAAAWAAAGPETQPLSTVSDGLLAERWATGHSDRSADSAQRHPAPADAQAGSTETRSADASNTETPTTETPTTDASSTDTPGTDTPSAESAGPVVHAAAPLTRRSNRPGTSRAPGTPGAPTGDGVWRRFFTGRPTPRWTSCCCGRRSR